MPVLGQEPKNFQVEQLPRGQMLILTMYTFRNTIEI